MKLIAILSIPNSIKALFQLTPFPTLSPTCEQIDMKLLFIAANWQLEVNRPIQKSLGSSRNLEAAIQSDLSFMRHPLFFAAIQRTWRTTSYDTLHVGQINNTVTLYIWFNYIYYWNIFSVCIVFCWLIWIALQCQPNLSPTFMLAWKRTDYLANCDCISQLREMSHNSWFTLNFDTNNIMFQIFIKIKDYSWPSQRIVSERITAVAPLLQNLFKQLSP